MSAIIGDVGDGNTKHNNNFSVLKTVTPISKNLAFALFIALPFLGGWVGYKFAQAELVTTKQVVVKEKIVEVQKELPKEQRNKMYVEDHAIVLNGKLISGYIGYRGIPVDGDLPSDLFEIKPLFETTESNYLVSSYVTLSTDLNSVYRISTEEMGAGYIHLTKIPDADPSNFRPISSTSTENYGYYRDNNYVFYGTKKLIGANPNTFRVTKEERLHDRPIASDGSYRYYLGHRIVKEFPRKLSPDRVDYLLTTEAAYYLNDTKHYQEVLRDADPTDFDVHYITFDDRANVEESALHRNIIDQLGVSGEYVYLEDKIMNDVTSNGLQTYPLHGDSWHVMKDDDTAYLFQPRGYNLPIPIPSLDTQEEMQEMTKSFYIGIHSSNSGGYSSFSNVEAAFKEYGQTR
jgi:hypothetical protein